MLRDFANYRRQVKDVWFPEFYQSVTDRMGPAAYTSLWEHVNERFDEKAYSGDPRITTSWEPGKDWTGTPFAPIVWAVNSEEDAAKFMGLVYCAVAIKRSDWWGTGRYENRGVPIQGRTYFWLGG
jgi:hypothetical protein